MNIALCVASCSLNLSTPLFGNTIRPSYTEDGARFTIRRTFHHFGYAKGYTQQWKSTGLTHIYFGVFRIALKYHGRKGHPIMAQLSLLDSRHYEYQHANLGMLEITLNVGTVFMTIFSNFTISLHDSYLTEVLKIHVKIHGVPPIRKAIHTNLYCQLSWRVKIHHKDLSSRCPISIVF
uniref:Uncharacterized protein n=1 Tax=Solanum lycopersicum TaxID=4081 RepID=K4DDM5_SOLLC